MGLAAAALMTAFACSGCVGSAPEPAVAPPPPIPVPSPVEYLSTLRVGLPAARRSNLLFECDSLEMDATQGTKVESPGSHAPTAYRWDSHPHPWAMAEVRTPGPAGGDTLLLVPFDESADEEIALERGELDVAVFWPGELSARMRSDARWHDPVMTSLPMGVVGCITAPGDTLGIPPEDMLALNREAFAGDLMPWSVLASDTRTWPPVRYTVDPAMPGARLIERVLARVAKPGGSRRALLVYHDLPIQGEHGAYPHGEPPTWLPGAVPVFTVRCPVLVSARAQPTFKALGTDFFAPFVTCARGMPR